MSMTLATRNVSGVTIVDLSGKITLGEGGVTLREEVRKLLADGSKKIVLNLGEVNYIDSSGLGELVKAHTTIRNQGGQLKLATLNKRVDDLLQMTHLSAVFDIQKDEASAIKSFEGSSRAVA